MDDIETFKRVLQEASEHLPPWFVTGQTIGDIVMANCDGMEFARWFAAGKEWRFDSATRNDLRLPLYYVSVRNSKQNVATVILELHG
jgi:hypothetical protein